MKNNYKLKIICLLCVITAAFSSCKKSEVAEEKRLINNHKAIAGFGRDGKNDLLGYGYNVLGEFANASAATLPVIDVDRLQADQSNRVIWDLSTKTDGRLEAGSNAVSYLNKLTTHFSSTLGADFLGLSLFRATITGSYNTTNIFASKNIYSSYNLLVQQKRIKLNTQKNILLSYLDSEFLSYIQNQTPESIVNRYGTHILTDITLGGKLEVVYQSETSKSDKTIASSAGVDIHVKKIFNLNTGYTSDNNYVLENFAQKLHYVTNGGDPTRSLLGDIVVGNSSNPNPTPTINIAAWQNSCTPENSVLIDISNNGLLPIYEFIPDQEKALAVKNYIIQYLIGNQAKELGEVPIYQYKHNANQDYLYSLSNNAIDPSWPGWEYQGPAFYGFSSAKNGSVPIYEYRHHQQTRTIYSPNPNYIQSNWPGWSSPSVAFYAYTQNNIPGTVPIFEFYNQQTQCNFYSSDINAVNGYSGWVRTGIAFYAFR